MARHRRRWTRRNFGLKSLGSAAKSAFTKQNFTTAFGIIGGTVGTTVLTDMILNISVLSPLKKSKVLNVLSLLFMSGVTGMAAKHIPFIKGYAKEIAIGGVVAGVTRALKYTADATGWPIGLSDFDGPYKFPLIGTNGIGNYMSLPQQQGAFRLDGFGNFTDPRQIANAYQLHGMMDYANFQNASQQHAYHLDGMNAPSRISEDDVTAAAMQGMM